MAASALRTALTAAIAREQAELTRITQQAAAATAKANTRLDALTTTLAQLNNEPAIEVLLAQLAAVGVTVEFKG
jgi:hypothetical protein